MKTTGFRFGVLLAHSAWMNAQLKSLATFSSARTGILTSAEAAAVGVHDLTRAFLSRNFAASREKR
jgi:hypothetical protein